MLLNYKINKMKKLIIILLFFSNNLISEEYTLDILLKSTIRNSGFVSQEVNYQKISDKEVSDILSNYYPQISIEGHATYQSDVFSLPLRIPGQNLPELRQDQYSLNLNISQVIWDGGSISKSTKLSKLTADINMKNSEIKIRSVIEKTANLFYSALKIDGNIKSINSALNTLENNKNQIISLVENGVITRNNLDVINLQISSKKQTLQSLLSDYYNILRSIEILTGIKKIDQLGKSNINSSKNNEINRPELATFQYLSEINIMKSNLKYTNLMPKFSAFAKVGYSNPNQINMFQQEWSDFYIVGLKMSWKPFSWFSESKNEEILGLQNENLEFERKEFLKQISIELDKELSEIRKSESLIEQDRTIIDLQKRIIQDKYNQFINGTATASEYIMELNSLQIYENNLSIHEIMLEHSKTNLLIKSGNYSGVQ